MKTVMRWLRNLLVTVSAMSGFCGYMHPLDSFAADGRVLWQSRDQFVALERQDQGPDGPAPANNHPAEVALDRLTAILESIDLRTAENDKPMPLFTKASIDVLAPLLQTGLRKATPGEDLTFAVIGLHQSLFGFAKSPKVTTGRFFYQGGRLNLIIGLVQQDVNEREDRRLSPFTPGSRLKAVAGDWSLIPHAGADAFTQVRKDWVAFKDDWRGPSATPTAVPVPAVEKKAEPAAETPKSSQPPQVKHKNGAQSPAERLTTLIELKEKGLITEEEYRVKRQEILNGL